MSMTTDTVTALDRIDAAIEAVEEARDLLPAGTPMTGATPNSEGLIGQAIDDLKVLRGRVVDPDLSAA